MKVITAAVGAVFILSGAAAVTAQPYGGYDRGPEYFDGYGGRTRMDRDREYDYRDRDRRYDDRYDRRDDDRYDRSSRRGPEFDEDEYLRCNADVRRAVRNGQFGGSGLNHYREYGYRENRRLRC